MIKPDILSMGIFARDRYPYFYVVILFHGTIGHCIGQLGSPDSFTELLH